MTYTATKLRQNLYSILDRVIEQGEVVEIERHGHLLRIVPEARASIWDRLEEHRVVNGDADDLVNQQWLEGWQEAAKL
ncbi:MAG: hypothetical protein A2087_06135 [Spirochaetes bacterium GWD1_61_31]|nr:MAG: hypothetical protein A2087_06135 [Spirochaetes bacterium GWD1_61_31]HAP43372.1 type II toxin-antitoxin system Phd/YefM family antitoxin [Spirochaetaceae bacterium]HAW86898.1 type II toxin-antitoxin system Phd/YefM family antitoxin [Spirochaetaceae bacterium]HAX37167.1 type II toxin-antitoxin system Phd/YefM family antitoxin [Spirochaetaceae bacterium]HBO40863.1 type II toxin-antitoxin system Phd/YefM family antitoxin [Spirochaetaceae bacterium]